MVRQRINELIDFASTESPYRSANKGWINKDVFLSWGPAPKTLKKSKDELANVALYWKPINEIVLIIFFVLSLAAILVVFALSLAKGKLFPLTTSSPVPIVDSTPVQVQEMPAEDKGLGTAITAPALDEIAAVEEVDEPDQRPASVKTIFKAPTSTKQMTSNFLAP